MTCLSLGPISSSPLSLLLLLLLLFFCRGNRRLSGSAGSLVSSSIVSTLPPLPPHPMSRPPAIIVCSAGSSSFSILKSQRTPWKHVFPSQRPPNPFPCFSSPDSRVSRAVLEQQITLLQNDANCLIHSARTLSTSGVRRCHHQLRPPPRDRAHVQRRDDCQDEAWCLHCQHCSRQDLREVRACACSALYSRICLFGQLAESCRFCIHIGPFVYSTSEYLSFLIAARSNTGAIGYKRLSVERVDPDLVRSCLLCMRD